ncbi:hypothetical protein F444_02185 [Phytophthora nicotianae P1976]|uniref:Uncharacterized protein n=1 Tax=Phytophthora nicotianae P1976 TaxID=1317066 RepID=A0A081AYA0_PHYNI|nr:hypothetical protein F444_02185 [Phytophthora nicotianae P1976]
MFVPLSPACLMENWRWAGSAMREFPNCEVEVGGVQAQDASRMAIAIIDCYSPTCLSLRRHGDPPLDNSLPSQPRLHETLIASVMIAPRPCPELKGTSAKKRS